MTVFFELGQKFVEKYHLARVHDQCFIDLVERLIAVLGAIEQVRVVSGLSVFDERETHDAFLSSIATFIRLTD